MNSPRGVQRLRARNQIKLCTVVTHQWQFFSLSKMTVIVLGFICFWGKFVGSTIWMVVNHCKINFCIIDKPYYLYMLLVICSEIKLRINWGKIAICASFSGNQRKNKTGKAVHVQKLAVFFPSVGPFQLHGRSSAFTRRLTLCSVADWNTRWGEKCSEKLCRALVWREIAVAVEVNPHTWFCV